MRDFFDEVRAEFARAQHLHAPMASAHEGIAVIAEEFEELWAEVRKRKDLRDLRRMRKEAIQLSAMAARFVLDICDRDRP